MGWHNSVKSRVHTKMCNFTPYNGEAHRQVSKVMAKFNRSWELAFACASSIYVCSLCNWKFANVLVCACAYVCEIRGPVLRTGLLSRPTAASLAIHLQSALKPAFSSYYFKPGTFDILIELSFVLWYTDHHHFYLPDFYTNTFNIPL